MQDIPPLQPSLQVNTLEAQSFVNRVFLWMFAGLMVTAGVAAWFASTMDMQAFVEQNPLVFFGAIIFQLVLVIALVGAVSKMSSALAAAVFVFYAGLNGFVFSMIVSAYTPGSIASTFAVTSAMFGGMALFGWMTKRDLGPLGTFLFMALIGLIVGSIVNIFFFNQTIYWILTGAGIVIFAGLTAYDMQRIKELSQSGMDEETASRAAVMGALSLYLDFINLFLMLLRIFGQQR